MVLQSETDSVNNPFPVHSGCEKTWPRLAAGPVVLCAEHVRQLGGASPLHNLMEVK